MTPSTTTDGGLHDLEVKIPKQVASPQILVEQAETLGGHAHKPAHAVAGQLLGPVELLHSMLKLTLSALWQASLALWSWGAFGLMEGVMVI